MKLVDILLGQSTRLVHIRNPMGGGYLPEVIAQLRDRYKFIGVPATLQDFDPGKGVTFSHGKFSPKQALKTKDRPQEVIIKQLQIFNNGVIAQSDAGVEYADQFIDDFLEWAEKEYQAVIHRDLPIIKAYQSQLEIKLENGINEFLDIASQLSKMLSASFKKYERDIPNYEFSGFKMWCDTLGIQPLPPAEFTIERRLQQPYSSSLYFSAAPLTTSDHLQLLGEIEKLAARH